jgi:uncharacterized repeat protein (TIGR01451 family)
MTLNNNASFSTGTNTVLQLTSSSANLTGSAWYNTPQAVESGFITSFQFQFTNPSTPPADGIAFVIQNVGTHAIGYAVNNGGALGYGDDDDNSNPSTGEGIPNSLAIEFDSFQNQWDPQPGTNGVSHVAIQSCGAGRNTSHHNYLCNGNSGPNSTLGQPVLTSNFADGNIHNVTIQYFPACPTCNPATVANIQVLLDGNSIYPNGIAVDLSSIGLGDGGTAYVGVTGATGGDFETQNILNWTFGQTQQGNQITSTSGLTQTFVSNGTFGSHVELDFDYSTASTNGNLMIQPDTTPFVTPAGISPFDWATIVNGTTMADAPCLIANGQSVCVVNTLTCTTSANNDDTGTNCPQSNVRNILFTQVIDLEQTQGNGLIVNGTLTIPAGYAPGMAMAPDALVSGAECNFPSGGGLAGALCPQSVMTQIDDPTVRTGGTATTANSTYVFFCCAPEWQTTATIPLWFNGTSVPASFTSVPPATPNPDPNNFHAAQGASIVFGAEPHGTILDTTFPLPGEQTVNNAVPCPALGVPPATPWSTQNAQPFSVAGTIATYDNNGTATPLTEGAYDAHYFSVDCDAFEELVYPAKLNVQPGTPGPNLATFKTVPFNIDTTPPAVPLITLNPPGGYYQQYASLSATVSCTDPSSPNVLNFFSGVAKCGSSGSSGTPQLFPGNQQTVTTTPIALSTSTLGTQTFYAVATDVAGNSTPSSIMYQVVGSADVGIGMVGNILVKTGTNMTYYIFVANAGPNTADMVTVTDAIPSGTTFVSSGYAIESCTFSGGQPQCTITAPKNSCGGVAGSCSVGNLPMWTKTNQIGALVAITVNVTAKANTILSDVATVSEANLDPNTKNNTTIKWQTLVTK